MLRFTSWLFVLILTELIFFGQAQAALLFNDGFENGLAVPLTWEEAGTGWSVVNNPANAHSGDRRGQVMGNTNGGSVLRKQLDTTNWQDLTLDYWYRIANKLEATDYWWAEWSVDGVAWQVLNELNNVATNSWTFVSHPLPAIAARQPAFQFRFQANFNSTTDVVWLDEVALTGEPVPTPTPVPSVFPSPTVSNWPIPTLSIMPGVIPINYTVPNPPLINHGNPVGRIIKTLFSLFGFRYNDETL